MCAPACPSRPTDGPAPYGEPVEQHDRTRTETRPVPRRRLMPRQAPVRLVPRAARGERTGRDPHSRPADTTAAATPAAPGRALPALRLTGRGVGLLTTVVMLVGGALSAWLRPGGPGAFYGLLFLLVCCVAALRVPAGDLAVAPLTAPTAFAAGLVFTGGPMEIVTALALEAEWLYGGTLLAVLLTVLRRTAPATARRLGLRSS